MALLKYKGFDKVLIEKSNKGLIGPGVIKDGKAYRLDGVTPLYKPNSTVQYKESEVEFNMGESTWIALYAEAIMNRCRRDLNLGDIYNAAEARKNLGLYGEVTDHYHDERYYRKDEIDKQKQDMINSLQNLQVGITGHITADPVTLEKDKIKYLNVKTVNADTINVANKTSGTYNIIMTDGSNKASLYKNPSIGFNCNTSTFNVDNASIKRQLNIGTNLFVQGRIEAVGNIESTGGTMKALKVYNAVWNDYAEFFPRGCKTEPGDIIALDLNSDNEQYILSSGKDDDRIVGVHSNEFAMLIGGEDSLKGEDYIKHNIDKYIPVALAGRVSVKFIGKSKKGGFVVPSKIPGVGKLYEPNIDNKENILGFLVESDDREDQRKLKIKIKS